MISNRPEIPANVRVADGASQPRMSANSASSIRILAMDCLPPPNGSRPESGQVVRKVATQLDARSSITRYALAGVRDDLLKQRGRLARWHATFGGVLQRTERITSGRAPEA